MQFRTGERPQPLLGHHDEHDDASDHDNHQAKSEPPEDDLSLIEVSHPPRDTSSCFTEVTEHEYQPTGKTPPPSANSMHLFDGGGRLEVPWRFGHDRNVAICWEWFNASSEAKRLHQRSRDPCHLLCAWLL